MSYPKNVLISALKHEGFEELQEAMIQELSRQRQSDHCPDSSKRIFHRQRNHAGQEKSLRQDYEDNDVVMTHRCSRLPWPINSHPYAIDLR